jgi:fumarate reductase subunit D
MVYALFFRQKSESLSLSKRQKILAFLTPTRLVLLVLFVLSLWVRYQFFVINGGLEKSYTDWAMTHYFGGITPIYVQGAENILHFQPWSITFYPPGYSFFLAFWKLLGINNLQTIRLAQAAVDSLTVFPIFYVLNQLGVRQLFSLCAAGVYTVAPLWAFGSVMVLAEALSPALIVWLLALMLLAKRQNQLYLWFANGLFVAFSALTRPDLILLIGPVLLWVLFAAPKGSKIRALAITFVGFASLIFFWGAYNKVTNGHWIFTTSAGTYALWAGLGQLPNNYGYFVNDLQAGLLLQKQGTIQFSPAAIEFWGTAYKNAWREHPDHVLKTIFWRISQIPFDHQSSYLGLPNYFEGVITYFSKYGLFVLGLSVIALAIQRKFSDAYIILLPLVYALGSLGFVYYESRYIRYVPLSYILAAAILMNLLYSGFVSLSPLLRKRVVALGLAAFALIFIGNYVSRNMLVLNEETTKVLQVNDLSLAVAQGRTKPIATLKDLKWTKTLPEVSFQTESDSHLTVKTSQGRSHYQLMTPIPVSNFSVIHVEYDVRVDEGGMALGLLLPDGSSFIETKTLSQPGNYVDSWNIRLKNLPSVTLVLMNSRTEDGRSRFVVRKLNLYAR